VTILHPESKSNMRMNNPPLRVVQTGRLAGNHLKSYKKCALADAGDLWQ